MNFCYLADECREKAERRGMLERVLEDLRGLENDGGYLLGGKVRADKGAFIFFRADPNFRTVVMKCTRARGYDWIKEGDAVFAFVDFVEHDESDRMKSEIGGGKEGWYREHYGNAILDDLKEKYKAGRAPVLKMNRPDEGAAAWLNPSFHEAYAGCEQFVLEAGALNGYEAGRLELKAVREIIRLVDGGKAETNRVHVHEGTPYVWFAKSGCLAVFRPAPVEEAEEYARKIEESVLGKEPETKVEAARLVKAERGYPWDVVKNEEHWEAVSRGEKANIVLSEEEEEVFEQLKAEGGRPVFLHGRAGSGKSSLMFFLFASYLRWYLENDKGGRPPLFVTFNSVLKDYARRNVEQILRTRYVYLSGEGEPRVPEESFYTLSELMRSLLRGEAEEAFDESRQMSYFRFKRQLWGKWGRNPADVSPESAWHVIRSHIKGYRPLRGWHLDKNGVWTDDELTPEEYARIERREKSVGEEEYRKVFEGPWERYRSFCREKGYWDDQDLAAFLLEKTTPEEWEENARPVVFCDEAQDFTNPEIEVILHLFRFHHLKLSADEAKRLPLFMAGDAFQTINPTMFRWEKVTSRVYKRMELMGERGVADGKNLKERQLKMNYRSTRQIVGFANLILWLRSRMLPDDEKLEAQESWAEKEGERVTFFVSDNEEAAGILLGPGRYVIVPWSDKEKLERAKRDRYLKERIIGEGRRGKGGTVDVDTPASVKGREFDSVTLYRFGSEVPEGFMRKMEEVLAGKTPELTEGERIAFRYFLNKLYVAATRASRRMWVVDSREALEGFWKFALGKEVGDAREEMEKWCPKDDFPLIGKWIEEEEVDWEARGKELLASALSEEDAEMAMRAAYCFEQAGMPRKAKEAKAYAAKFEEKYRLASDLFREAEMPDEALKTYRRAWRVSKKDRDGFRAVMEKVKDLCEEESRENEPVYLFAQVMTLGRRRDRRDFVGGTERLVERLVEREEKGEKDGLVESFELRMALNLEKVLGERARGRSGEEWRGLREGLERLHERGWKIDEGFIGRAAFNEGDMAAAVRWWDKCDPLPEKYKDEYNEAMSEIVTFPGNIKYLRMLEGGARRIVVETTKKWGREGNIEIPAELTEEEKEGIAEAATKEEMLSLAVKAVKVMEYPGERVFRPLLELAGKRDKNLAKGKGPSLPETKELRKIIRDDPDGGTAKAYEKTVSALFEEVGSSRGKSRRKSLESLIAALSLAPDERKIDELAEELAQFMERKYERAEEFLRVRALLEEDKLEEAWAYVFGDGAPSVDKGKREIGAHLIDFLGHVLVCSPGIEEKVEEIFGEETEEKRVFMNYEEKIKGFLDLLEEKLAVPVENGEIPFRGSLTLQTVLGLMGRFFLFSGRSEHVVRLVYSVTSPPLMLKDEMSEGEYKAFVKGWLQIQEEALKRAEEDEWSLKREEKEAVLSDVRKLGAGLAPKGRRGNEEKSKGILPPIEKPFFNTKGRASSPLMEALKQAGKHRGLWKGDLGGKAAEELKRRLSAPEGKADCLNEGSVRRSTTAWLNYLEESSPKDVEEMGDCFQAVLAGLLLVPDVRSAERAAELLKKKEENDRRKKAEELFRRIPFVLKRVMIEERAKRGRYGELLAIALGLWNPAPAEFSREAAGVVNRLPGDVRKEREIARLALSKLRNVVVEEKAEGESSDTAIVTGKEAVLLEEMLTRRLLPRFSAAKKEIMGFTYEDAQELAAKLLKYKIERRRRRRDSSRLRANADEHFKRLKNKFGFSGGEDD